MKTKILRKEKTGKGEVIVLKNTFKPRLPMAPKGFSMKSKKDIRKDKRIKITVDNWDRI